MTTALATLHSRLGQLRLRRQAVRAGLAWSALLTGVLLTLALFFLIDWALEMSRLQRCVALLGSVAAIVWVFRAYSLPWLGVRESDVDLALIVERNQHIDSDLVAALQFESHHELAWGSPQLKQAVIDYVDDFSGSLNVFEGFSYRRLKRRLSLAGALLAVSLLWTLVFPGHVRAFVNRLLLGSAHYPTDTRILRIAVSGKATFDAADGETHSGPLKAPHGEPLSFLVHVQGKIPRQGLLTLRSLENSSTIELTLERDEASFQAASQDAQNVTKESALWSRTDVLFRGELPRLVDSVAYQIELGDAWTDPLEVHAIPLPVVTVELTPHPPKYAAGRESATESQAGTRQIAVLEGSRVDLKAICGNKPLSSATLTIPELPERKDWPLSTQDPEKRIWELRTDDSPFADVRQPLRYQITATDEDGLSLERPLQGYIRLKADRPPRVAAAIVSRKVVPTAQPRIVYGAADDFGVSRLVARVEVSRKDGRSETSSRNVATPGARSNETVVRGEYAFDLTGLQLEKGDEIKITLEAFDFRGDQTPKSTVSEPLVLQVTDREGILAGLQEADEKSARQLDAIIQRELGIGESK